MWPFDLFRGKAQREAPVPESFLSQFLLLGGHGDTEATAILVRPKDEVRFVQGLESLKARLLANDKRLLVAPPIERHAAAIALAAGLSRKIFKKFYFESRFGFEDEGWKWRTHFSMNEDHIERQDILLADGRELSFYFDYSEWPF